MNAVAERPLLAEAKSILVEVVRTREGFASLEAEWDELYERSRVANPFLSFAWTRACFEAEGGATTLFIMTLRRSGTLIGIAPLCIERKLGFRQLRFIADDRSDYLGFLHEDEPEAIERRLLLELAHQGEEFDLITLRKLAEPFTAIGRVSRPEIANWTRVQWTTAAYCRWNGDWESLHEGGPLWLKQMRNRRKRFLKKGRIERYTGIDAAARLDEVSLIEAESWKGRQGLARLQPGPGQEILRNAFLKLGSQMELWLAYAGDQPIAFQIDFLADDCLWLYQYSYVEEFSNLRAGSVIGYSSIEHAWLNGAREYDFLTGDESYKSARTTALRPIHHIAGYRRTLRGRMAYWTLIAPRWRLREVPVLKAIYSKLKDMVRVVRNPATFKATFWISRTDRPAGD